MFLFTRDILYHSKSSDTILFPSFDISKQGGDGVGECTAGSDRAEVETLPLFCHYVAHTHLNQIVGGACAT